jgi:hypothetical protein
VKGSSSRSSRPPGTPSGRGPVLLLVGGVGLAISGVLASSFGVLWTFQPGGGPTELLGAMQWIGLMGMACGAFLAVASVGWWIWRIGRARKGGS